MLQVPHYTDGFSLLLNASLLARFAAPLCYNFLYVLRMQDSVRSGLAPASLCALPLCTRPRPPAGASFVPLPSMWRNPTDGSNLAGGEVTHSLQSAPSLTAFSPAPQSTVFLEKMGVMQEVPFLGAAFNTWWPLMLVLFCLVLALNMGERISRALGITRFDFAAAAAGGGAADDEHTERGRHLLRREQEVTHDASLRHLVQSKSGLFRRPI